MNTVSIIGNLTRDGELRFTPRGTAVAEFGVAINERYKDEAGNVIDKPVFVDVTAWGATAENICKWFGKGDRIGITGKLALDQWEDKQTGQHRSKLKVIARSFHFCGPTSKSQQQQPRAPEPARGAAPPQRQAARQQEPAAAAQEPYDEDLTDDIPF